jgi:hypothetical protein
VDNGDDSAGSTESDRARLELARMCAEADRACVERDAARFASAIHKAIPLAADQLTAGLTAIVYLALFDFDSASARWRGLRLSIRVRRRS